jgi:hypothetical protein
VAVVAVVVMQQMRGAMVPALLGARVAMVHPEPVVLPTTQEQEILVVVAVLVGQPQLEEREVMAMTLIALMGLVAEAVGQVVKLRLPQSI